MLDFSIKMTLRKRYLWNKKYGKRKKGNFLYLPSFSKIVKKNLPK